MITESIALIALLLIYGGALYANIIRPGMKYQRRPTSNMDRIEELTKELNDSDQ